MYYAVYEIATGRLHAIERDISRGIPEGMAYVEVEDYAGRVWDEATHTFGPAPAKRTLSRKEFIERLTVTEWTQLVALKASDPAVAALFERLALLDEVELDSGFVRAMAAHVVRAGYLSAERCAEIVA
jgi:hypothetical protein